MGRSRYHVLGTQPHFLTCTLINWMPLFGNIEIVQIILESLNFLQCQQRLTLYGYVIMENHLHLIAAAANQPTATAAIAAVATAAVGCLAAAAATGPGRKITTSKTLFFYLQNFYKFGVKL